MQPTGIGSIKSLNKYPRTVLFCFWEFTNTKGTQKSGMKIQSWMKHGTCLQEAYSLGEKNSVLGSPLESQGGVHTNLL